MLKLGQRGVAPILALALILAGVVAGIIVLQQNTDLIPEAKNIKNTIQPFPASAKKCLSNAECGAGYECKLKNLKPLPSQACKNGKNPNCVNTATDSATPSAAKREYGTCHKVKGGGGVGSPEPETSPDASFEPSAEPSASSSAEPSNSPSPEPSA